MPSCKKISTGNLDYSPAFSSLFFSAARPTPAHSPFDFCFSAQYQAAFEQWRAHFESAQVEGPHLHFSLSAEWLGGLLNGMDLFPQVLVAGNLRDAQVAAALREPRKQIRRYVKLFEPLSPSEMALHLDHGPWRKLALALLGFAASLQQAQEPWAPNALANALKGPLRALIQVWESEVVDPGDPRQATAQQALLRIWRDYFQAILSQITP